MLINFGDLRLQRLRLLGIVRNGLLRFLHVRIRLIVRRLIEKVLLLWCLWLLHFFSDGLLSGRTRLFFNRVKCEFLLIIFLDRLGLFQLFLVLTFCGNVSKIIGVQLS